MMLVIGRVFSCHRPCLRFSSSVVGKVIFDTKFRDITDLVAKVRMLYPQIASSSQGASSSGTGADGWSKKSKDESKNKAELDDIEQSFRDCAELHDMATECNDTLVLSDCQQTLQTLQERLEILEMNALLSHDFDPLNCYIQINAGAGGTESCDWVGMLYTMYHRWAPERGYHLSIIDEHPNVDVSSGSGSIGYRSITLKLMGEMAYGWFKNEAGVHRLVRISPFDPQKKRHTSFAQVVVYPDLSSSSSSQQHGNSDPIGIDEIKDSDLKIDTFRASGAGGQHVNKTDSAIRLTHKPTGIIVSCQAERSQHQNRAMALSMLQSRLRHMAKEQEYLRRKETTVGAGGSISWGNQIRSVVMQPYQMVKDHRTGWETGQVDGFLQGNDNLLTEAMLSTLRHGVKN